MKLNINEKTIEVRANAFTLVVYEDTFKRRLLKDIREISENLSNCEDISFSVVAKLFWAAAKTADESLPDFYDFIKDFTVSEITGTTVPILNLIVKSTETRKKARATVRLKGICQRLRLWRLLHGSD